MSKGMRRMSDREQLLTWIEEERETILAFLQDFIRAKSPNPPGDTTEAVGHICRFLKAQGVDYKLVDPQPITGADVQDMATLALARVARDGEETLLLQVDPDFTFDRAQRGRPRITAFDADAWGLPGASAAHPISASLTTVDLTLPRLRYLVHPDKDPLSAVERLPQPQPA